MFMDNTKDYDQENLCKFGPSPDFYGKYGVIGKMLTGHWFILSYYTKLSRSSFKKDLIKIDLIKSYCGEESFFSDTN